MIAAEAENAELEAARFEFAKCFGAGIDVRLLSKAVIPALCGEHERHPIIARIGRRATERFLKALAISFICHFWSPERHQRAGASPPRAPDFTQRTQTEIAIYGGLSSPSPL